MNDLLLWFSIYLIVHIILSGITQKRIKKTVMYDESQKKFHNIMNWIVPFLWFFIVKMQTYTAPKNIRAQRDKRQKRGRDGGANTSGFTHE
jgi:tryptophan-rich sensory protein